MTSLQQFLDKHFMSVKDITGYLMWNVVNTFMICFEPLFKLIPFYNNLDNVKLIINKNSKKTLSHLINSHEVIFSFNHLSL